MFWKKLACCMALTSVALVGCGDDDTDTMTPMCSTMMDGTCTAGCESTDPDCDEPDTDAGMDAGRPMGTPLECGDCFYVADELAVGQEDPVGVAPGFNIDGIVSDGSDAESCLTIDYMSPDGVPGIDNQLAMLAPTLEQALGVDLATQIGESLAEGAIIVLMEVEGVESTEDDEIQLSVYIGNLQASDDCAMDAAPECITAGKTFDIDSDSVNMSGMPLVSVPGRIEGGVVKAGPIVLPLTLTLAGAPVTLTIREAQVEFDLAENTLTNGLIGGSLNIPELIETVMAVAGEDVPAELVQTTLESVADLEPDADGVCQNVSVAITFHAVNAVRGMVIDDNDAGTPDVDSGADDASTADAGTGDASTDAGDIDTGVM